MEPTPETPKKRSILAVIFISPDEPRLRAGWRLLLQTILMSVIGIVGALVLFNIGPMPMGGPFSMFYDQILNLVIIGGSIFIARRWLDRRSFASLGFQLNPAALRDLLVGIAITGLQMGATYLVFVAAGWSKFDGFAWDFDPASTILTQVGAIFIVFVFVGWNEELLSRGYHMQTLASGLNLTWGIIISSAIFGALHLGNPNATWVSAAGIFFAGIFLAYGFVRTGQMWLPIGLHIGWNFFEGVVFGFPVSGLDIYRLLRHTISGPEIWTGGAFGPEAGLIVLPALALGAALIYIYTRNRAPQIQI